MISVVLIARGVGEVDLRGRDLGGRRDRDHVVETHHDVGDGDNPDRAPKRLRALDAVIVAVGILGDELGRHVEQQRAADELEVGIASSPARSRA